MRIVQCNTKDCGGGAANAARRLHRSLLKIGEESIFAVMQKTVCDDGICGLSTRLRKAIQPFIRQIERIPLALYTKQDRSTLFSPSWRPSLVQRRIRALSPDIIHLHWIADSFLPLFALANLPAPVIWTLHDTWALTGGCHILKGCTNYQRSCGSCPQLSSRCPYDLSALELWLKAWAYRQFCPTIIAPSRHMERLARQSSLLGKFQIECVPNGIDTNIFRPIDKKAARDILRLPQNTPIILFGAVEGRQDPNKGFDLLQDALQKLSGRLNPGLLCTVFGGHVEASEVPFPVRSLGELHDDTALALAYAAADVFVCPSREENLPYTVMEALACGTPTVAFAIGGIPDMIENGSNGMLAAPFDTGTLADNLVKIISDPVMRGSMGKFARERAVAEYDFAIIARRHKKIYDDLLGYKTVYPAFRGTA